MGRRIVPQLDRERLIAASFAVVEEHGLEDLSMRRLAAQLGVQAPAIYWHVADKAELLGLMAREIYAAAYAGVPKAADWREWLMQFGQALRTSFSSHRDGARICAIATPAPHSDPARNAQTITAPLVALGLDRKSALIFQAAVISYVLGWNTFEANGPMHDYLDRMMIFEESFRVGLGAMIAGFVPTAGKAAD